MLVAMGILVSLSDLFGDDAKVVKLDDSIEERTPTYVAVLYGLIFPGFASFFTLMVKYVNKQLKLETNDWM